MSQQPYYNAGISAAPPVVVQGTYVSDDPYSLELRRQQQPPTAYNYPTSNTNFGEYQKVGEVQPRRCNDGLRILFIVHLVVMVGVAATYAPQMIADVTSSASSVVMGPVDTFYH